MTFHTARHTFATVSLMLGLKIETVSDILGHAEISTTQRKAHIVDELRDSEMDHWDKLSKDEFLKNDSKEQAICPSCENLVFAFEKETIKLKKFPVECSNCGNDFFYKVGNGKKTVDMKIV